MDIEITELQEMVQVARMYYKEGLTQDKIAKEFGISRSSISILLTEAKKKGIVQINILDPMANNEELSAKMELLFGIDKCIVVPGGTYKEKILLQMVALQAAKYISGIISSHTTVGISWGSSCYEFIKAFPTNTELCDIDVVPLIGGSPLLAQEFKLNESVLDFAEKLRGIPTLIYSPGMVDSLEDKKRIMDSTYMQSILQKWADLDLAILGIGRPPKIFDKVNNEYLNSNVLKIVNETPDIAVGDLCARRFNIKGDFVDQTHNDRLIGIDENGLKNAKKVLALAIGSQKIFSIIGALNTKLLNYLVLDEITAINIIEIIESHSIDALH